jgi:hypothetical protein
MHETEWSEVVATTTPEYLKGASDLTIREHPVFATLEQKGKIFFNQSGTELRWTNKFGLPDVEAYTGGAIGYEPSDKHRQLVIDWRGYRVSDMLSIKDQLMNRGAQAIIDRYSRVIPDMEQAMRDMFAMELYVDGTTYTDRFCGLETFMQADTDNCLVGDIIAPPSGTYGGWNCEPGTVAGAWSASLTTKPNAHLGTDWPDGTGDTEYGFNAPKLVNYGSTSWGTTYTTWAKNAERALRRTTLWLGVDVGKSNKPSMYLMTQRMYYDYLQEVSTLRKIDVPARRLIELGFDGVMQDGVELTYEYGVPEDTCYGLNLDKLEMHCMTGKLFESRGPEWDMRTACHLFLLFTFGNWKFVSPKFFAKLYPYATQ